MPTPEELKSYAGQLPPIYRDIVVAFHEAAGPYRKYGEGMSVNVLGVHLSNEGKTYTLGEILAALEQLEESGFFTVDSRDLVLASPTPLGEELIEAFTGSKAPRVTVPPLPKPPW